MLFIWLLKKCASQTAAIISTPNNTLNNGAIRKQPIQISRHIDLEQQEEQGGYRECPETLEPL
jgi:hypothetical protein